MRINILGEGETDYLRFADFTTDVQSALGRPLTSTVASGAASDICMRSAPINAVTLEEIRRLAQSILTSGCRFTYASNQEQFRTPRVDILSLGTIIQQHRIADPSDPGNPRSDMGGLGRRHVLTREYRLPRSEHRSRVALEPSAAGVRRGTLGGGCRRTSHTARARSYGPALASPRSRRDG
ncbi:hypothetical protein [Microbacterium deminutum]|uniref:Uncharacterized protein n=1 Tax=Microbacterium deminutum TaxID=344164 RepID=A0ABP5CIJ5_9MICO